MTNALKETIRRSAIMLPFLVARRRRAAKRVFAELTPLRIGRPADPSDVVVNTVLRDEMLRLPDFFRHYRGLGVRRFVAIDNGSTDGSLDYLLDQPDVDVYTSTASFRGGQSSVYWTMALIGAYHRAAGFLMADADEHLVYDDCERYGIEDLVRHLEAAGRRSLPTLMLDMYPQGAIRDARPSVADRLVDVCSMFDATGYRTLQPARFRVPRMIEHAGGPRERLFSIDGDVFHGDLAKTPLVRWDADVTQMYAHAMHPYALNFGEPTGCLLHLKLMGDFHDRARLAVDLGNHYAGSREYRQYLRRMERDPDMSAVFEGSRRYVDSGSVVAAGLMSPITWK